MPGFWREIRRTVPHTHLFFIRYAAGAPLGVFGIMHLTMDDASIEPILRGAGIPLVQFNTVFVPLLEIAVAFLLATGFLARVGAALGAAVMMVALYAHGAYDWQGEMTWLVPLGVLLCCLYTTWRGAGAWSTDLVATQSSPDPGPVVRTVRAEDIEEHVSPEGGERSSANP